MNELNEPVNRTFERTNTFIDIVVAVFAAALELGIVLFEDLNVRLVAQSLWEVAMGRLRWGGSDGEVAMGR